MKFIKNNISGAFLYIKALFKWVVISFCVGAISGVIGSVFHLAIDYVTEYRSHNNWIILLLPIGGLIIAFLYGISKKFGKIDTNRVFDAVKTENKVPIIMAPLIFISTIITHLLGGSAGREGAALQLGGSIGYNVGKIFRLNKKDLHIIVMSGMSAVFAALFGTPLTAAVFSLEVVSVGIKCYAGLVPCIFSAIVASRIALLFGLHPVHFDNVIPASITVVSLGQVILLAVLCAVVSILFCVAIKNFEHYGKKFITNNYLRALAGGALIVVLTILLRTTDYNGAGMDIITEAIAGKAFPLAFLIKILFTAITISAGFKGGEIVPAFFVGSTFGCVCGAALGLDAGFGAAIGFITVFCGAVNSPLASVMLSLEVFGASGILLFALACGVSYMMSGRFSLYENQTNLYSKIEDAEICEIDNEVKEDKSDILKMISSFRAGCDCGVKHDTTIQDVQIASGLVNKVGEILKKNDFSKNLLVVADKNTIKAADGILESLKYFNVECKIYDDLRVATMDEVESVEALVKDRDISVLSVGTGSLNDTCRLAAARQDKKLCIFATAPSMDGFASYGAPIVNGPFKATYPAKSPEVIIGDTKILAKAPSELKSAGFGDMVAKYVGLIDWQISTLLTGEYYCERIANLTREAIDELMQMADKVTVEDEATAGKIFEALLKTGIAMSFAQNSRPASGAEHIVAHLIECVELRENIIPNFHGDDVGVCTLETLKFYNELAERKEIDTHKENLDWEDIYEFYGSMAEEVRKLNTPDTITDSVCPDKMKDNWAEIVKIIKSVPSYEECKNKMEIAGCKITVSDIGKSQELFDNCFKYSPYMRRRLTLLRLRDMIK